ncbi:glycosyltransferase [Phenylobacterium conjunctum]|uniref:glycosyltransferase n=1 Tax=Phenylobacterium conjunctum TaxID=1298959 RepID=UPI00366CE4CA
MLKVLNVLANYEAGPSSVNILVYIPQFTAGGAELMMTQIAGALMARGHGVAIVVDQTGPDRDLFDVRVPVEVIGRVGVVRAAWALSRIARRRGAQVVISALPVANLVADLMLLVSGRRVKVINTWHGYFGSIRGVRSRFAQSIVAILSRISHANVSVSADLLKSLRCAGASSSKFVVIYNGVHIQNAGQSPVHGRRFIFSAGSLTRHKNHRLLIEAFARLGDAYDGDLLIAGQGPELDALRALSESLDIADRVHLVGFQSDIMTYMEQADIFVLPSDVESFGIVLVQAMAAGVPVISTDAGGTREVLGDGEFGTLIPVGDVAALADAILRVLSEPMPDKGRLRERAEYFSIERVAAEYEALCRGLVAAVVGHS